MKQHLQYMSHALELATIRQGFCAPNPAVGAVVVKNGQILATGYHQACGQPHAEVEALHQLSAETIQGATLYVTLEPCCHWGKTPPCTQKIIDSGIAAVYYGYADTNPQVAGNGIQALLAAGVACEQLPLAAIDAFYQSYSYWWRTKTPRITAKIALSLDGKIAGVGGKPVAITGPELQQYTHQWRKRSDAILTTVKTIIQDDPQLNVRLERTSYRKPVYILDSQLALPLTAKIVNTAEKITLFHADNVIAAKRDLLKKAGIACIAVPRHAIGLDLMAVMQHIGKDGVHDLWVEAGGRCFTALVSQQLAHRVLIYVSLKFLGNSAQAATEISMPDLFAHAEKIQWQSYGKDAVCVMEFNS